MTYLILVALMMIIQQGKSEYIIVENAKICCHPFSQKLRETRVSITNLECKLLPRNNFEWK